MCLGSTTFSKTTRSLPLKKYITHRIFPLVAFLALMLLAMRFFHVAPIIGYASVFISSSVVYVFICRESLNMGDQPEGLLPLLLVLFIVRLSFLGTQPIGSDDVYRYMWDGRVQTAGINPYRYAPEDPTLRPLQTDKLPSLVNHPDLKTIYFPLSEWIFYFAYSLSGEHVWGIQLFILVAEVLTIAGLFLLLRELSLSAWRVLIYAASPLIILQFSFDAHVDVLGFPFLIFGLLLYLRKKTTAALLLFGCSLLIKPTLLVILPALFLDQRGIFKKVKVAVLPLTVMLLPFIPYTLSTNPFDALSTFSKNWFFNGALFSALLPLFSDNQTTRLWCLALFAIFLTYLLFTKRPTYETIVLSVLLLILCSPVAHVWYIGWLIILLPLAPISSGLALAATASLASVTFVTYQLQGIWKDFPIVLLIEYLPVVILLYFDLRKNHAIASKR